MEKVINYIEESFNISNNVIKLISFKDFINYLNENNITLSIEDAILLLSSSNKLCKVVKYVKDSNMSYTDDNGLDNIFLAYDLLNESSIKEIKQVYNKKSRDLNLTDLYMNEMPKLLSDDETKELLKKAQKGDLDAKNKIVESNLRLVVSIAKKYYNNDSSFMDLVQEGNMGLMRAVDKFDSTYEVKFASYAVIWIKQYITRYIENHKRTVRVPVYMHELMYSMNQVKEQFENTHGREPSREELAKELNISLSKLNSLEKCSEEVISLETKVKSLNGEESSELNQFIEDERLNIEEEVIGRIYLEQIKDTFFNSKRIDERSKQVIFYRYGFYDGKTRTLEEVGNILNITKERVRQIEKKALTTFAREMKIQGLSNNNSKRYSFYNSVAKKRR